MCFISSRYSPIFTRFCYTFSKLAINVSQSPFIFVFILSMNISSNCLWILKSLFLVNIGLYELRISSRRAFGHYISVYYLAKRTNG